MLIGQEYFCQGQGVAGLASIDEGKCRFGTEKAGVPVATGCFELLTSV
jgi:hypothetical protein